MRSGHSAVVKVPALCLLGCAVIATRSFVAAGAETRVVRVSPTGPSPAAAVAQIRAAKAAGDTSGWTVRVAPGFYELREPLVLRPEDSGTPSAPVRWTAEGGEAVFAGGGAVSGWRDDGDGSWSAPLPKDAQGRPVWFQSLFINGRRAVRARHPNAGFFPVDAVRLTAVTNADGLVVRTRHAVVSNAVADVLTGLSDRERAAVELQARVKWQYGAYSVAGWDPSSRTLTVVMRGEDGGWGMPWQGRDCLFCLENVRAGFDAPGEWFYDVTAGRVRYRPLPGERLSSLRATAPTSGLASVVRLEGDPQGGRFVTDVVFEGISFSLSRTEGDVLENGFIQQYQGQAAIWSGGCVYAKGARRVSFERCRVTATENYAIRFDVGCVSNRVVGCELTDLGGGGVMIGDTKENYYQLEGRNGRVPDPCRVIPYGHPFAAAFHPCAFVTVDDCTIAHAGLVNPEACGVLIAQASDCAVTHCDIHDIFYTGVSVGWTWGYSGSFAQRNTIAFNRIFDLGKGVMSDMGGVYTLGASFGTCVSNNVIHSISSLTYGGWGLYNDEGSEGIVCENNLVYDTKDASYHLHYGRDNVVRNNILACAEKCQLAVSLAEQHRGVTFDRNIVYWEDDVPVYHKPMWMKGIVKGTAKVDWTNNVFWCASGPTVINASHPAVVADPLFVDAKARDFRLKPGSPAPRFGFRPWDISQSGRRKRK